MTPVVDWDDPAEVEAWLHEQSDAVAEYLRDEGVWAEGQLVPSWYLAPYVAVWQLRERDHALPRLWIISGDLPTSYAFEEPIGNPRAALAFFAERFTRVGQLMIEGRSSESSMRIGDLDYIEQQREWGDLLKRRGDVLLNFVYDQSNWNQ